MTDTHREPLESAEENVWQFAERIHQLVETCGGSGDAVTERDHARALAYEQWRRSLDVRSDFRAEDLSPEELVAKWEESNG